MDEDMFWQNQKGTSLATLSFGHSRDEHWRVSGATWILAILCPMEPWESRGAIHCQSSAASGLAPPNIW